MLCNTGARRDCRKSHSVFHATRNVFAVPDGGWFRATVLWTQVPWKRQSSLTLVSPPSRCRRRVESPLRRFPALVPKPQRLDRIGVLRGPDVTIGHAEVQRVPAVIERVATRIILLGAKDVGDVRGLSVARGIDGWLGCAGAPVVAAAGVGRVHRGHDAV